MSSHTIRIGASILMVLLGIAITGSVEGQQRSEGPGTVVELYGDVAERLIREALRDSTAYDRLAFLVDQFGPRLSGSENLESAIAWILTQMRADGLENVRGEEVMVPHWVRGAESAELLEPRPKALPMLALGGSVGTPGGGSPRRSS